MAVTHYGRHVWEWFWQLERSRRSRNGLEPLSHLELDAWARLYDECPARWELDALFRMDAVRRETFAAVNRVGVETPQNKDPALVSMVPFNAAGVRSMLGARRAAQQTRVVDVG